MKPADTVTSGSAEKSTPIADESTTKNAEADDGEEIADDLSEISDEADDILNQQEVSFFAPIRLCSAYFNCSH